MTPIHCTGTLKTGNLAGKPCKKFLGELTVPYRVCCSRCGTWHESEDTKGDAQEMATTLIEAAMTEAGRLLHENGCNCATAQCNTGEDEYSLYVSCPNCKVQAQVTKMAAGLLARGEVKR